MGLGNLKKKLDLLLALDKGWGAIEEGAKMGNLKPVVVGLVGAVATALVGAFTSACPDLKAQGLAILVAAVGGAVGTYALKPATAPAAKASLAALGGAAVAAGLAKVTALCPDLIAQAPQLVMAGVTTGVGLYLRSHREE